MGKSCYTIEYLKYYVEIESNSGCKLLSTEYNNNLQKLKFQCKCGEIFETSFSSFKNQDKRQCDKCSFGKPKPNRMLKYEYIKEQIESNDGYKLLSKQYKGATENLEIQCPKGHIFIANWNYFQQGKRCPICAGNMKHSGEFICNEFLKRGYLPQFKPEEYIDNKQLLPYICKNHINQGIQYMCYHNLQKNRKCYYCALESRSGENHYDWKNGISQIKSYLSRIISQWKNDSINICNYNCVVTGLKANGKFNIHHLYSMELIMNEVYNNINLLKKKIVNEYNEFELQEISNECIRLHKIYGLGICIHPKIHRLFHITYGYRKTIPQQFQEFINRLANGEFNVFLKENNLELNINYYVLNKLLNQKGE